MNKLEKAKAVIQEARESHVQWADWVKNHPEEAKQPRPEVDVAGDARHHEIWIENYDLVLEVLEEARNDTYLPEEQQLDVRLDCRCKQVVPVEKIRRKGDWNGGGQP